MKLKINADALFQGFKHKINKQKSICYNPKFDLN